MNLLEETKGAIKASGHKIEDIIFIGSELTGHQCTWDEFRKLADKEYDCGFGAAHVATDLIIVFSDNQQLVRGEYDGSEWWSYNTPFKMPKTKKKIYELVDNSKLWKTLEDFNRGEL